MTPAQLIKAGECTASCLAAITGPTRCTCPCKSEFHGLVKDADITGLLDARKWRHLNHLTDLEIIAS